MTTTDIVITVLAGLLVAGGIVVALAVDVRAHTDRPRLDRLWLLVPVIGTAVLFAAVIWR